jgi:hypothetical protein
MSTAATATLVASTQPVTVLASVVQPPATTPPAEGTTQPLTTLTATTRP